MANFGNFLGLRPKPHQGHPLIPPNQNLGAANGIELDLAEATSPKIMHCFGEFFKIRKFPQKFVRFEIFFLIFTFH